MDAPPFLFYDSQQRQTYPAIVDKVTLVGLAAAAHEMFGGRRVFMHDVIMGLDTLEDEVN